MYIKNIENWNENDWWYFFMQFTYLNKEKQKEVKQILTLPDKSAIEQHFDKLEEYWIINWIWPWYFIKIMRNIISWLFKGVRYEWHDIMYSIWGNEKDRLKADYWLLKYSIQTIKIWIAKAKLIFNPISMWLYYIASFIQLLLAYFCYFMVVLFWRFWSFRYL